MLCGGSAPPRAIVEKFHDLLGVFLLHAWGMTETSPIVTTGAPLWKHEGAVAPSWWTCRSARGGRFAASN